MAIRHKRKATTGYTWQSADLVSGQIGVNTADGTLHVKKDDDTVINVAAHDHDDTYQGLENGFPNRTDSTISFTDTTRTFSIAPTNTSFTFVSNKVKFTKTSAQTTVITDTDGIHVIYFDQNGNLTSTQSWTDDIILKYAIVAIVYWDETNNTHVIFADERHGDMMSAATHLYLHSTEGARYDTGLGLGDMTVGGSGNAAASAQFSVGNGAIWDEDIKHLIEDGNPQDLATVAQLPILYRSGELSWRKIAATGYCVTTTGSGRAAYNQNNNGLWQLTEATNNYHVLSHVIATNDAENPIVIICGQKQYSTVAAARDGALSEGQSLLYGGLGGLLPEWVLLGTVIVQTNNTYTNAVKSRIVATEDGSDYVDWRTTASSSSGGISLSDHGQLSGLSDDDHTQYALADGTRGDFASSTHNHDGTYLSTSATLDDLSGVTITTATTGQVLKYNGTAWVNDTDATGSAAWGSITGTLSDQTDLNTALSGKVSTSVVDAKGDLLVGTANDTVARLAVGTNGYVLTADSNEASGIKWAAASGGSVPEYIKQPVRGATTANLASLSGNLTVDGLTTAAGDRILVKNQTTASQNGIYVASASAWTRATDFDTGAYIGNGCVIPVAFGTVNGGSTWQLVQNGGTIGNSFRFAPVNGIAAHGQAAWTTPTASNTHAIAVGSNAKATGEYSVCVGREAGASACGNYAVLLGTSTMGASGSVAVGNGANANNTYAIRIGTAGPNPGANTISLGPGSVGNFANSQALSSSGFGNPVCEFPGQIYFSTGYWADATGSLASYTTGVQLLSMRMYTTNATETEMGFGGDGTNTPTGRFVMSNHTTYVFDYDIVARNTASTETSAWNIKFVMQKGANNASTALVGDVTKTLLGQTSGASTWDVTVTADTTNGRPKMAVIGAASTNIRWAASGRFTRVAV